jgi:hypothetical protein
MLQSDYKVQTSAENEKFNDYLKNGDDFSKIEIYHLARYWYRKAFETGIQADMIKKRIDDLNEKIRAERKILTILAIITAVIIAGVLIARG